MEREEIFAIVVILISIITLFYLDMRSTNLIIPKSSECNSQHGISFSNATSDSLYRIHNTCFGWTNQGDNFPYTKLKRYTLGVEDGE